MYIKNAIHMEGKQESFIIIITGDITPQSDKIFEEALKACQQPSHNKLILKVDSSAYINSGGIALIIQFLAATRNKFKQIFIVGASDHFKKIFKMVGITKFATLHDSLEASIQNMSI